MDLGLKNRRAVVTGGSKGIGKAIAYELAMEGVDIAICARGDNELQQTAAELRRQTGRNILAIPLDVTVQTAVDNFITTTVKEFGSLDILINNAGSPVTGTFEEVQLDQWRQDLDVKLFAPIYLIHAALPHLKRSNQPRIININSIVGRQSTPEYIANSTDRAACLGFNKVLSDNLAKYGILVNSINPGNVKSEAWDSTIEYFSPNEELEQWYETVSRDTPLGRVAEAEEIAALTAFLASKRASYITGASIDIDGGLTRYI
ncbi:MAG: short-chain dehydrogenase [Acidiferrobacteraceae bacterium]|nr:short-chain dehydrogenase [Acidiferrobacteraceae bacterium]|tara:strand:+ start:228 stop:1010 length:783 start_codon:yes stop_codon:yes gene_type:complete